MPPPAGLAAEDGKDTRSNSKQSNSSSEDLPGRRQMKRTMENLREDVSEVEDDVASLKLRLLWLMSQEVRRERQEASRQLIIQGFEPRTESSNYEEAIRQRERFIRELLAKLLRTSTETIQVHIFSFDIP